MFTYTGLRAKCYSFLYKDPSCNSFGGKKTAKGIKKSVKDSFLTHKKYEEALFDNKITLAQMQMIRSKDHKLSTELVNKVALSKYDDKVWVLPNGYETRALFHYKNAL